ncbi:hypothetical protein AOLI_G00101950 [Acnodon oligacanthus]
MKLLRSAVKIRESLIQTNPLLILNEKTNELSAASDFQSKFSVGAIRGCYGELLGICPERKAQSKAEALSDGSPALLLSILLILKPVRSVFSEPLPSGPLAPPPLYLGAIRVPPPPRAPSATYKTHYKHTLEQAACLSADGGSETDLELTSDEAGLQLSSAQPLVPITPVGLQTHPELLTKKL